MSWFSQNILPWLFRSPLINHTALYLTQQGLRAYLVCTDVPVCSWCSIKNVACWRNIHKSSVAGLTGGITGRTGGWDQENVKKSMVLKALLPVSFWRIGSSCSAPCSALTSYEVIKRTQHRTPSMFSSHQAKTLKAFTEACSEHIVFYVKSKTFWTFIGCKAVHAP